MRQPIFEPHDWSNDAFSWMTPRQIIRQAHSFRRILLAVLKARRQNPARAQDLAESLFKYLRHIEARKRSWPVSWRPEKYQDDP
jgi:hypothetical protein